MEVIEEIHALTHPLRYRIIQLLAAGEPMFIGQIADRLKANPRLVSFHLTTLLNYGIVEGEWQVSKLPRSKGKAVKYYRLTGKGVEALQRLARAAQAS